MIKPLFQNILIGVNGQQASLHACMYGIMMAKQYKLKVKAVFVVDVATLKKLTMGNFFVTTESKDYEAHLCTDGKHSLQYIEELAKQKGITIQTELRKGAVWAELIKAADDFKANMILVGGRLGNEYRANSYASRNVAISVARHEIISNAHCSVLVVKDEHIEQMFKLA